MKPILDIASSNTGVLLPRLSTFDRDAIVSPANGLMLFNTTDNRYNYWNGSLWVDFNSNALTLPFSGTGVENSGGQAGLFKIINTGLGNGLYVKSGSGATIIAAQSYAAYFESSENGIFAGGGAGKLALRTSGKLLLGGNSEGTNKILTSSDNLGNAVWSSGATLTDLTVNGNVKLGTNGTTLTEIIKVSRTGDLPSMAAGTVGTLTFSVTNAQPGSTVYISPSANLPAGIVISHALSEAPNAVEVKFFNASNVAIDPPLLTYYITVIR